MPLYEYQCSKCGNVFEVIQKFSDAPLTVHEGCGGEVVRLISRSAFQLKGSGWYVTDYARGSSGAGTGEAKNDAAKADSAKSESKAESTSPSTPAPAKSD
jgi:putative FmdB family regulatory protein